MQDLGGSKRDDALGGGASHRGFGFGLIVMHWITAITLILGVASIELREFLSIENPIRPYLRQAHYLMGFSVFLFVFGRLYFRFKYGVPPSLSSKWVALASRLVQGVFYILMFCQPVVGLLQIQSGGGKFSIFGCTFPVLINESPAVNDWLKELHSFAGNAFILLVLVHVAGALVSHYMVRDETLRRMLDLSGARGRSASV